MRERGDLDLVIQSEDGKLGQNGSESAQLYYLEMFVIGYWFQVPVSEPRRSTPGETLSQEADGKTEQEQTEEEAPEKATEKSFEVSLKYCKCFESLAVNNLSKSV